MRWNWYLRLSALSFFIIACMGLLMRAKVVFEMPWVVQKHVQLAHAFFAFNGWVSFTLLWLLWYRLEKKYGIQPKGRMVLLFGHYTLSIGLLGTYLLHGMSYWSFVVETLLFAWMLGHGWSMLRAVNAQPNTQAVRLWLWPAWIFQWLGSAGMMFLFWHYLHRSLSMSHYLSGFYSYLHYQYNGWFLFAALSLLTAGWEFKNIQPRKALSMALVLLSFTGVLLSLLWRDLPLPLYALAIGVALAQLLVWLRWCSLHWEQLKLTFKQLPSPFRWLFALSGAALLARMSLQLLSTVPQLEQAAFSFRAIVIAYLHLVLLGIFSSFLFFWLLQQGWIAVNKLSKAWIWSFILAFMGTELLLGAQGTAAFAYLQIPFATELVLGISGLFPVSGLLLMYLTWLRKPHPLVGH